MQTFLPYDDFDRVASILDNKRLGKQRVEALQIMGNIVSTAEVPGGWHNHPAVKMWTGHEYWLMKYQTAICRQWTSVLGYKDTCWQKTMDHFASLPTEDQRRSERPWWLGDEAFHLSHQSNLIRKNPAHYGPLFPGVPDDLEYVWPTS